MSTAAPLVSIIIPTHDDRRWICDAIDSALAQTYGAREIIVVDDGSTDGTAELIRGRYGDAIACVRQPNRGLAAARNVGSAVARGDYVQFLDADDLLAPEKLAVHVAALEANPGCDVVYSDFAFIDVDGRVLPTPGRAAVARGDGSVLTSLIGDNFIVVHAALSRLDAVRAAGGFDEMLRACEDYDLWLRLAARGSDFLYAGDVLAFYRRREHSMSMDTVRQVAATIRVIAKVPAYATLDHGDRRRLDTRLAALREMRARALLLEALRFARGGRVGRAVGATFRAFAADPGALPRTFLRLVTGRGWRAPDPHHEELR